MRNHRGKWCRLRVPRMRLENASRFPDLNYSGDLSVCISAGGRQGRLLACKCGLQSRKAERVRSPKAPSISNLSARNLIRSSSKLYMYEYL